MVVTVREYAEKTGLSDRRVRALIEAGDLEAQKVGGVWLISQRPPEVRKSNRSGPRLSPAAFDRLADYMDHRHADLTPKQRYDCKVRTLRILSGGLPAALSYADRNGLSVRRFVAGEKFLPGLRVDELLVPTGISDPRSGIVAGGIDGYVAAADLDQLVALHGLCSARGEDANVTLRVVETLPPRIGRLHLLTDLAQDSSARSVSVARGIFAGIKEEFGI